MDKKTLGRIMILNGSPHEKGTTRRAIDEVAAVLTDEGFEVKIHTLGALGAEGCRACGGCAKLGKCVIDDVVNELAEEMREADGVILASPVYYAAPNGAFLAILNRLFYSTRFDKTMKVGASIVAARRAGLSASFDVLNKYFSISGMPVVSSYYWDQIHGKSYDEAEGDLEGLDTMRSLGKNMAFLIKAIKDAKEKYTCPEKPSKVYTNFIR